MPTTDHSGVRLPADAYADPLHPPGRHRWLHWRGTVAGAVAILLVLGGLTWWITGRVHQPVLGQGCTVVAGGQTISLDAEQAGNAGIITAVAVRRGLPARAATIALATALQESKLRNINYGDRDSLGLFQQRPSQGWGTKAQVTDPVYASNAFYDVLVKIEGYRDLPVTKAAQKVQRSAYPSAYADHEEDARVLASALSGNSPAAFTCVLGQADDAAQAVGPSGRTPRGVTLAKAAERELGATVTSTGAKGTTIELRLPNGGEARDGWAIAQWAVARAQGLHVVAVTTDGQSWSRADHPNHWTRAASVQLAPGHALVQVS